MKRTVNIIAIIHKWETKIIKTAVTHVTLQLGI